MKIAVARHIRESNLGWAFMQNSSKNKTAAGQNKKLLYKAQQSSGGHMDVSWQRSSFNRCYADFFYIRAQLRFYARYPSINVILAQFELNQSLLLLYVSFQSFFPDNHICYEDCLLKLFFQPNFFSN